jgi:hypothetical protein
MKSNTKGHKNYNLHLSVRDKYRNALTEELNKKYILLIEARRSPNFFKIQLIAH